MWTSLSSSKVTVDWKNAKFKFKLVWVVQCIHIYTKFVHYIMQVHAKNSFAQQIFLHALMKKIINKKQTFTCRSSAVVSSNSSPSLKEISVFLKVLSVLTTTLSPSWLMTIVGLVTLPTCLVAKPTPVQRKENQTNITNKPKVLQKILHACTKKNQTLHVQRSIKILVLTQGFHVLIKILAVHQFPGCTKCINHLDNLKNVEIKHEVNFYNYRVHKVPYVSALRRLQSPE